MADTTGPAACLFVQSGQVPGKQIECEQNSQAPPADTAAYILNRFSMDILGFPSFFK